MIRAATESDLMQMYHLAIQAHEIGPLGHTRLVRRDVIAQFRHSMANNYQCCYVDEGSKGVCAVICGLLTESWWDRRKKIAVTMLFFSNADGDMDALLSTYIEWAWSNKSVIGVHVARIAKHETNETVFTDNGMNYSGGTYISARPRLIKEREDGTTQ